MHMPIYVSSSTRGIVATLEDPLAFGGDVVLVQVHLRMVQAGVLRCQLAVFKSRALDTAIDGHFGPQVHVGYHIHVVLGCLCLGNQPWPCAPPPI